MDMIALINSRGKVLLILWRKGDLPLGENFYDYLCLIAYFILKITGL